MNLAKHERIKKSIAPALLDEWGVLKLRKNDISKWHVQCFEC